MKNVKMWCLGVLMIVGLIVIAPFASHADDAMMNKDDGMMMKNEAMMNQENGTMNNEDQMMNKDNAAMMNDAMMNKDASK